MIGGMKTHIHEKANNCTANEEDGIRVIQLFEEIIKNKKSDILWLAYYQSKIFQKGKEKEWFISNMVLRFNISKSTIKFLIALSKPIYDYPKIKARRCPFIILKTNWESD